MQVLWSCSPSQDFLWSGHCTTLHIHRLFFHCCKRIYRNFQSFVAPCKLCRPPQRWVLRTSKTWCWGKYPHASHFLPTQHHQRLALNMFDCHAHIRSTWNIIMATTVFYDIKTAYLRLCLKWFCKSDDLFALSSCRKQFIWFNVHYRINDLHKPSKCRTVTPQKEFVKSRFSGKRKEKFL